MGFLTVSLNWEVEDLSSLINNSCWIISCACSTQFSQICPSCPAIRIFTSSRLRPQNEQCNEFFAIGISYNQYLVKLFKLSAKSKSQDPGNLNLTPDLGLFVLIFIKASQLI